MDFSNRHFFVMAAGALIIGLVLVSIAASFFIFSKTSSSAISLGEGSNNETIVIKQGDQVKVSLHSTYWTYQGSSNPTVLAPQGTVQTSVDPNVAKCLVGTGCGIVSLTFQGLKIGESVVSATRQSCGEVIICTNSQKNFRVTIQVK
jgi:hypothetical protein